MQVLEEAYDSAVYKNSKRGTGSEVSQNYKNSAISRQMQTVNKFNQTTQKEIIAALRAVAADNAESEDTDIAFKVAFTATIIRSVFNKLRNNRKSLIKETAVFAAYNAGLHDSAEELSKRSGQRIYKVWNTMGDTGVREAHKDLDGQRLPVFQAFSVDGSAIRFPRDPLSPPGLTINCRCFLTFEK